MILVLTGNGKGKTTSALGTALRAAGWGKKVALVFFDKGGAHYGEQVILDKLKGKINVFRFGLSRFDEKSKTFRLKNAPGDFKEAHAAAKKILDLYNKDYFLIIADELLNALRLGLIKDGDVRNLIGRLPKTTYLMLTGRVAPDWLAKKADLISDVREVKHYFRIGQSAIKGIDY